MAENQDQIKRCPKCGYPDVYVGALKIECGYTDKCPNWTEKQAEEVERLQEERYPTKSAVEESYDVKQKKDSGTKDDDSSDDDVQTSWGVAYQMDLDYDDDADTPIYPYYNYGTD